MGFRKAEMFAGLQRYGIRFKGQKEVAKDFFG
jgi:hypothetical protein